MTPALAQRITSRIAESQHIYHRLVLVVGPAHTGKTMALLSLSSDHVWPYVNVNLALSERLLELTTRQRAHRVPRLLGDIAAGQPGDVLLLDNTEMLFHPDLRQDPLRLLQGLARNRTVVAVWRGQVERDVLTYAEPGHPEYLRLAAPEALLVIAALGGREGETDDSAQAEEKRA